MKNLFLIILSILTIFSQFIIYREKHTATTADGKGVPILYWTTDANPVRIAQITAFTHWLKKNGYPPIDLRVDAANQGTQKIILQGVTGVASDLFDIQGWPTSYLGYFREVGLLEDVTPILAEFNVNPAAFYQPVSNDLFLENKIYAVSANSSADSWVVNLDVFAQVGMTPPPYRWTLDEFEKYARSPRKISVF